MAAKRRGVCFFFFQAEDGIRDYKVTGVQTCALPIGAQAPWHFLNFLPLPQGQGSLRPGCSPLTMVSWRGPMLFQIWRRSYSAQMASPNCSTDRKSVV